MTVNPEMLVIAREARGWTQRQLASALGRQQATLSRYEVGTLRMPEPEVDKTADILRFDVGFFHVHEPIFGLGSDFLYRKKANVPAVVRRRVRAEVNIRRLQVQRLMERADIQGADLPFPTIEPEEMDGRVDAIAQEVRRAWRLPRGPIRHLTRTIETAGGIVFSCDFATDLIDGTNVRMPGTPPLVFVNNRAPGDRHRFNLAHELGHAVMHSTVSLNDAEAEANAFAQEFLMPKAEIRSDLRGLDLAGAAALKSFWGVSMAALIRRAHDLRQITESQYRRLNTALSARGLRTREPVEVPMEDADAFNELLRVHHESFGMGPEEMRRILFTDKLGPLEPPPDGPDLTLSPDESLFGDGPTSSCPSAPAPPSSQSPPSSSGSTLRLGPFPP